MKNYEHFTKLANELIEFVNNKGITISACNNISFDIEYTSVEISKYSCEECPTLLCRRGANFILVHYNDNIGLDFTLVNYAKDDINLIKFDFINGMYKWL